MTGRNRSWMEYLITVSAFMNSDVLWILAHPCCECSILSSAGHEYVSPMACGSAEAYSLYKELNYQILEGAAAAETKGVGVEATNQAIVDALTNPKPKTRVIVGQKAMLLMRLRRYVLPDRFFDWIVLNTLSKYSDVNN
jgi:hypothetical protein